MAVELNLNRYVANPSPHETDFQRLERRNRERTYLVLFVHDRSLSMQCNKHWMLPVDDLVKNAGTWHERGGGAVRPEDVILAAFVSLRRIAVRQLLPVSKISLTLSRPKQPILSRPAGALQATTMLTSTMSLF